MIYILFDLDGTILNTRDGIVASIQKTIATSGIIIDDLSLLERHIGPPLKNSLMEFYNYDEATAKAKVEEYRGYYKELGIPGTKPYEGIEDCLKQLKMRGAHLLVATSKPEEIAKKFLKHFQLDHYFDDICGSIEDGSTVRDSKAKVIRYTLEQNHINHQDKVIMVGDRLHDVKGAQENEIPCVGVLYGFGSEEELMGAGAVHVVRDARELTGYLIDTINEK